jgi:cytidylate kinase
MVVGAWNLFSHERLTQQQPEEVSMVFKSSSERLAEAMERARRHWQAQRKMEAIPEAPPLSAPAPFTIALSREAGANGTAVARAVAEKLGWPVYDRELLQRIADDMGLHASLLESVDEKRVSWLQEITSASQVSAAGYVRRLIETVLSLGRLGACVIVGRGAAQILPPETTLRVRLVAPLEARITAVSRKHGVSREEAARQVKKTDRDRSDFVMEHFHKDPADSRHYDLVLNSARFSVVDCAEVIIEALRRLEACAIAKGMELPPP